MYKAAEKALSNIYFIGVEGLSTDFEKESHYFIDFAITRMVAKSYMQDTNGRNYEW